MTKNTKMKKYANSIISFISSYFRDSNIHGLQYVVKSNLTTVEKCLWLTLVTVSMFFCVEIGLQSVDRYYTKSTVVGVERDFYYWNTTLPGITICPLVRLDEELFSEYCRQHKLSADEKLVLFQFLEKLANSTFTNFIDIPNNKSIDFILDRLNIKPNKYMELIYNVTGDKAAKSKSDLNNINNMAHTSSEEFIIETRQVLTEYGLCYMANTLLSQKMSSSYLIFGKYPVNELRGMDSILQVKKRNYFDMDVFITALTFDRGPIDGFLHSSYEVMRVDQNLGYSDAPSEIHVDCIEIIAEEGLEESTSLELRKCRFQHESNLTHFPVYTRIACQMECRLNLVYKICKCIPHFYPNRIKNPKIVCDYKTLRECLAQHENLFIKLYEVDSSGNKQMVPCYCAQNCLDAIVNKKARHQLQKATILMGGNSILISLSKSPTYRLKRLLIFSFTDLLVCIGGNAGLFLGFSVLCLVEVVYYFTLRLLFYAIKMYFQKDHMETAVLNSM